MSVPVQGHKKPEKNHENHHGTYVGQQVEKLSWASSTTKLADFLNKTDLEGKGFELRLPMRRNQDFVISANCKNCGHREEIYMPLFKMFADQYNKCPSCGMQQPNDPVNRDSLTITFDRTTSFSSNMLSNEILDKTLSQLGFAPLDILLVKVDGKTFYYELSADKSNIFPDKTKEINHG